jgi:hypothetical protein
VSEDSTTNAPKIQAQGIFEAAGEAFLDLVQNWEPTNDSGEVAAGAVRQALDELPGFLATISGGCHSLAEKIGEALWMEDGGPELLHETGKYIEAAVDPLKEVAVGFDDMHRTGVDKIETEDEKAAGWDWGRHHA